MTNIIERTCSKCNTAWHEREHNMLVDHKPKTLCAPCWWKICQETNKNVIDKANKILEQQVKESK
jgi:hypothetical protein